MAAGKTLKVKRRYQTRPPSDPAPAQASGSIREPVNIKNSGMSPALEENSHTCLDPQPFVGGPGSAEPMNISRTSFEHADFPASVSLQPPPMASLTQADILSQQRRRKSTSALKRSASTPNVRNHHHAEASMTLAEKRRNKLGYHRTSIACSHCRRRKIRCLIAPNDPHNRCANCIRLKKECNFFPVDQQPPVERRPRNPSNKADPRASSSADSSPALAGGHVLDQNEPFSPYQALPLSTQGFPTSTAAWNNGLISPMTRGTMSMLPAFLQKHTADGEGGFSSQAAAPLDLMSSMEFAQPSQQPCQWQSPFPDSGPLSAGHSSPGDISHPYWGRQADSPLTSGYPSHGSGPTSSLNSISDARSSFTSFAPSRADSVWSAPSRSLSIGVVEDFPPSYQRSVYSQSLAMDFQRRASEMYPPSLTTSTNSSNTSISEPHMTPLSAPLSSPPQRWGIPSTWNALPSSAVIKPTDFGKWYPEPALANVQEEEVAPPYGERPAILYAGEHQ
ncbi:MAG: hypothetical protein Q9163_006364 [Psora crenata]